MLNFTQNFHTHTWRCRHATGTEREYIENAIEHGIKVLGFSDHTPYWFPKESGYYSTFRMFPDQLEGYVDTILSLKKEYASDIELFLGLEVEYYPAYFDELMRRCEEYPFDYFIQGQHLLGNEIGEPYTGDLTEDPAILERYVDQTIEGMRTGKFLYLAHPDLIHYIRTDSPLYQKEMRRLCEEAKKLGIPLEINMLGIWDHRWYPNRDFWKIVGEVGNDVVLGSDAHRPDKIYVEEALKIAEEIIAENQLHRIEEPTAMLKIAANS